MNRLGNCSRRTGPLYLAAIFLFACSGLALAQISEYDVAPPESSLIQPPPPANHANPGERLGNAHRTDRPEPGTIAPAGPNSSKGEAFSYTVRSGDTLSSIAEAFGLQTQSLARANHISPDTMLASGKVLKIPNPFAARVGLLDAQIAELKAETAAAEDKAGSAELKRRELGDQIQSLTAANVSLKHELKTLPWWRGLAWTALIAALLLLGIAMLTLFEWWVLRRRFNVLARMNESLSRLDNKYKALLAKAELRFQQLYGRRRPSGVLEPDEHGKTAEEIEIERLNRELREALAFHLERLGLAPRKRRKRWNESFEVEPSVEARSLRR